VLILCAIAACAGWLPIKRNRLRVTAGVGVAAMGFTMIGLEMLLLLAFQAIYGYIYQQLAVIIAGFMVGMALGSWLGLHRLDSLDEQADIRRLARLQVLAALSPLLLFLLLHAFAATKLSTLGFLVSQILFPILAVFCGLFGGYQFPIASRLFFAGRQSQTESTGTLYALDLAGSCLGAIVLSSYLVPVFGFQQTAWLMAVVNLAPAALLGLLVFGKRALPA